MFSSIPFFKLCFDDYLFYSISFIFSLSYYYYFIFMFSHLPFPLLSFPFRRIRSALPLPPRPRRPQRAGAGAGHSIVEVDPGVFQEPHSYSQREAGKAGVRLRRTPAYRGSRRTRPWPRA